MREHTVTVGTATSPAKLEFAPVFNVAVPFIDRHLEEGRSHKIAIRSAAGEVSYGSLAEQVNRCGNGFKRLEIGPGERVLLMIKDCPEFFYAFWGGIKAGVVPVPVNTLLRARDYRFMIEDSQCAAVVYSREFAAEVEPALEAADHRPRHALPVTGAGRTLQSVIANAPAQLAAAATSPSDDCFWLYSSGSTGAPKGAVHRHRHMVVSSQYYGVETLGLTRDDTCFSAAKLFFAYGLGNAMTFPLWVGATSVLLSGKPDPQTTFETIERFRPTVYFGVPTLYAAQLRELEHANADLSSLRGCVSAGEALPPDILRRWKKRTGLAILDGIGSTEALHIFISNTPDDLAPGTSGRGVPGYQLRIVDDDGRNVVAGEPGRLLVKGDSCATHYWNNADKTAATMIDGWLHTGDTYRQDAGGHFVYCGRNDDMLKVGGIWCSPFEIEAKLVEHPRVLEAAVVGRADDNGLIKPQAVIVLTDPEKEPDGLAEELLLHCKQGLAPYKYPRWFRFVTELPKTATEKIQRFKLRGAT